MKREIGWAVALGGSIVGLSYSVAAPVAVSGGTSRVKNISLARTIRQSDQVSREEAGTEVWDVYLGKLVRTLPKFGAVAFAPGDRFLSIAGEQSITLWSPRSGALMHTLPGAYIAFSPDGAMAATGADNTLRLWNIKSAVGSNGMD